MTQDAVAYTWEIDGRRTLNPDVFYETSQANGFNLDRQPLIQIDCPRGAHAGKARLLFGKDDAAAIVALEGPQTIMVRKWTQAISNDGAAQWTEAEKYEYQGYYVLRSKDAFGVDENSVVVELADARYLLESTFIRKRFNVIKRHEDSDEYDTSTLFGGTAPYGYQQILDSILNVLISPPLLTIPVSYAEPQNLIFDCTLADALDQLLGSLGCVLIYDPLTGLYRIIDLTSAASQPAVMAAKGEGRLIEKSNIKASAATLPDKLNIRPGGIAVLSDSGVELPARTIPISIGLGTETVNIDDHQLTCDTSRITNAVNAWYGEQNFLLDETYQGVLKQPPAEHLSNVCWYFEAGAARTRIQNNLPGKIPWPKQPTLARIEDDEEAAKPAFMVQGVLGIRSGITPGSKFPAWAGDANTAYVEDSSLVVLSPPPYTVLVPFDLCKNPHGLNGEEGDTFVAVFDPNAEEDSLKWILIAVYPKRATLFFEFADDRPNGLYDVDCSVTVKSWRHPGHGPAETPDVEIPETLLIVVDTMGRAINAKEGDYGYADWNTDKQCWSIIASQHHATRILGHTNESSDGDGVWQCDGDTGFDGYVDNPLNGFDVVIDAGWVHPGVGAKIWFEFNPVDGTWYAYQLEASCPAEGG